MTDSVRDVVSVSGPDTWKFLQNLLSQDLDGIADGERRATLLLTPQGKVDVVAGITRRGDDAILDTDPGWGAALAESLNRFKIRTKIEIAVVAAPHFTPTEAAERARIEAGVPRMGLELDASVIPQEAFLENDAVSFTKGCFIGQELVCRIDTRGHVNRFLRRLRADDPVAVMAPGSEVRAGGKVVGQVTSSVPGLALAYVRREVEPPSLATVGSASVTVEPVGAPAR